MKKLLLATTALLAMTMASNAAMIDIGTNPTSATGNFSFSPGSGSFEDQAVFHLTQSSTFTIANATNTFAAPPDAIVNWQASIWSAGLDQVVNNGDDQLLFGPQSAGTCFLVPNCQQVGGSGTIVGSGTFYAEFTGIGSGTSGYSGNISTFAAPVPGPTAGSFTIASIIGLFK